MLKDLFCDSGCILADRFGNGSFGRPAFNARLNDLPFLKGQMGVVMQLLTVHGAPFQRLVSPL